MNITFERRADRPDAQGRYAIRLVATFDNQRLRLATGEKCRAAEWNDKSGWFHKSFGDIDILVTKRVAHRGCEIFG